MKENNEKKPLNKSECRVAPLILTEEIIYLIKNKKCIIRAFEFPRMSFYPEYLICMSEIFKM